MIKQLVHEELKAMPQRSEPLIFNRRTSAESNFSIYQEGALTAKYHHIRMLDAKDYPHAFLELHGMTLAFRHFSQKSDDLYADVKIIATPPIQTSNQDTAS